MYQDSMFKSALSLGLGRLNVLDILSHMKEKGLRFTEAVRQKHLIAFEHFSTFIQESFDPGTEA